MKNQKGISTLIGLIIIIAIAVLSFGGVFAYQYFKKSQIPITNDQQNSNVQNQNETAGWKTYTNSEYGFEFKYPKDVNLKETPPPSGMGLTGNTVSYQINFDIKDVNINVKVTKNSWENYSIWEGVKEGEKIQIGSTPNFKILKKSMIDGKDIARWLYYYDNKIGFIMVNSFVHLTDSSGQWQNVFYEIIGRPKQGTGNELTNEDQKTLDLFLSTFKFTK